MKDKMKEYFPWMPTMQEIFLNSFDGDCKIDTLKKFQQILVEEMQKVLITHDLKKSRFLLKGVMYFYNHFCRILPQHNKFSYHMERTWVLILSSIIKICVFQSRGGKKLGWIEHALDLIRNFPGEKHLVYDALLYIHNLDTKHKAAYAAILKGLLIAKRPFTPAIIDDPAEFSKLYLLVRRLKMRLKNRWEKTKLHLRTSKILAPRSFAAWLWEQEILSRVPIYIMRNLNLGENIDSQLGGSDKKKFLRKLREVLLPELSSMIKEEKMYVKNLFEKKEYLGETSAVSLAPADEIEIKPKADYVLKGKKRRVYVGVPENDKEAIAINETTVKNKKLKGRKENQKEDEDMTENRYKNVSKNYDSTVSICDNDELVLVKKSKKKKSIHLEENSSFQTENAPLQECSPDSSKLEKEKIKRQRKLTLTKIGEKMMKRAIDDIGKDSSQPKAVVEQMSGKRKQHKMVSDGSKDYENELKIRRKREKVAAKNSLDNENVTFCDPPLIENISQTVNITENRKKKRQKMKQLDNTEENGLTAVHKKSDTERSTLIFPESSRDHSLLKDIPQTAKVSKRRRKKQKIKQSGDCEKTKLVASPKESNEDPCLSNSRIVGYDFSCSDSEKPVVSCPGLIFSCKKKRDSKKKLKKSNPYDDEAKVTAENIFTIDSDSVAYKIECDTIYNAEPENILGEKNLNSSHALADLQEKDLPPEGTKVSCISSSSDFKQPISKKISSGNHCINVNSQICLSEEGDKDIPAGKEKYTDHAIQIYKEYSQDSKVKTESLDYSNKTLGYKSIKSDATSKKLMDGDKKTDFEGVTIQKTNRSPKVVSASDSHEPSEGDHSSLNSDSCAQAIEMQKDEHPLTETIGLVSDTDNVDILETNFVAKTTENCADLRLITQKNKVPEPLIDATLRIEEISSLDVADIRSTEKIETNCSVIIDSETPPESLVSNLTESEMPLYIDDSSLEVVIKEEKLDSNDTLQGEIDSELASDSCSNSSIEIDRLEVNTEVVDTNTSNIQRLSPNGYFAYVRPVYELKGLFFDAKSPTSDDLHTDSKMLNHQINDLAPQSLIGEAVPYEVDTPNTSAAKAIMGHMLMLADIQNESTGQNVTNGDFTSTPVSLSINNLLLTPLVKNEKPAECLSFSDISIESVGSLEEIQKLASLSSESVEFLQYRDSSQEDDTRSEDTLSENKSILKADGSDYHSDATNGSESEEGNMSPGSCNSSDDVLDGSANRRACETYVVKTECNCQDNGIARLPLDMLDADDELEDDDEPEDDDQQDTKCSHANETDKSTKIMQLKSWMWNPVVNLGERCDSKRFIDRNSIVSVSSLGATNPSEQPVIKTENEEKYVAEPFSSNQSSFAVEQLSIEGKHDEVSKLESDVKIETQIKNEVISTEDQKSAEPSNVTDSKATIFHKSSKLPSCDKYQEAIELKKENELSQDQKITGNGNSQECSEIIKDEDLGIMPRNISVSEATAEKSMASDKSTTILSQDTPTNLSNADPSTSPKRSISDSEGLIVSKNISEAPTKNLRSRNPLSSSQGKSASVNEGSNAVNQDNSASLSRNLRSRDPCSSSSQVKSVPANDDSQDATATRHMNLRSRNASTSSAPENKKRGSQTVTIRSSKRIRKEVNLDFDFSELSLNSPKALRGGRQCNTTNKNCLKVVNEEPLANDQEIPSRRLTRASNISTVNTKMKEQETDFDGYSLRSRKPVIMPGKLQL